MDLSLTGKNFYITTESWGRQSAITIENVSEAEVIGQLSATDIVKYFPDMEDLLDEIGVDYVCNYFGLKEDEGELNGN